MTQQAMLRTTVFHDATSARRAIHAAIESGFMHVHVITEDPAIQAELQTEIGADSRLASRSPAAVAMSSGLIGAGVGLLFGFAAAWFLPLLGIQAGIGAIILPTAGAVFGGFMGTMVSRGVTFDAESFYDQELGSDEIVVAIESRSPARLALAEQILGGDHRKPIALPRV
jgi:divalent metal cation (Fe/Co/Zn/Cd) transporter